MNALLRQQEEWISSELASWLSTADARKKVVKSLIAEKPSKLRLSLKG